VPAAGGGQQLQFGGVEQQHAPRGEILGEPGGALAVIRVLAVILAAAVVEQG
jgi:hypothetical protein